MANKAPGFAAHPEHTITLSAPSDAAVAYGGTAVARSNTAIHLTEDRYPPRAYLPRADITAELKKSEKTTYCPFKGDTVYFHVTVDGATLENAAWSYETPFDEMAAIAHLVAFDDRFAVSGAR